MKEMLLAFYMTCLSGSNYDKTCSKNLHTFQYVFQYDMSQPDVPYKSWLDQNCSEMPESCEGFKAAEELSKLMRNL